MKTIWDIMFTHCWQTDYNSFQHLGINFLLIGGWDLLTPIFCYPHSSFSTTLQESFRTTVLVASLCSSDFLVYYYCWFYKNSLPFRHEVQEKNLIMYNNMGFFFPREGIMWSSTGMDPGNCTLIVPLMPNSESILDVDLTVTCVHLNMCHFLVRVF